MAESSSTSVTNISLDDYFQLSNIGSIDRAIGNNLFGINHRQIPGLVPNNRDTQGLTFFVRPQLNMQADNLRNVRKLSPLLTTNPATIHRYIRGMLDPRLLYGYTFGNTSLPALKCPSVDNLNAFIPILTNDLTSISGWPDIVTPAFTSKTGLYKEVYSQVDGITSYYESFDIDATFRNTRGDPVLFMFYIWQQYMSLVFEGKLVPYPDFITENTLDYNTRIYRLVLDQRRQIVTKVASCGVAFPISSSMSGAFDFNNNYPYNDQIKTITIRFRCLGAEYNDDITLDEFNKTVIIFNPYMRDAYRDTYMVKVTQDKGYLFNNRGYPRINTTGNNELEWYVPKNYWIDRTNAAIKAGLLSTDIPTDTTQNNTGG